MKNIKFLDNLKIKTKLNLAFGLILLMLLIVGFFESNSLKTIEKVNHETIQCIELNNQINNVQTSILKEALIIMEIINCDKIEELNYWETEFNNTNNFAKDAIEKLNWVSRREDWGNNFINDKNKIFNFAYNLDTEYKSKIINPIESIIEIKKNNIYSKNENILNDSILNTIRINNVLLENLDISTDEYISNLSVQLITISKIGDKILLDTEHRIEQASLNTKNALYIFTVVFGILIILLSLFAQGIILKPIKILNSYIDELIVGKIPKQIELNGKDETIMMMNSLNSFIKNLKNKALFAKNIGEGNLNVECEILGPEDQLGNALIEMQNSIKIAEEKDELAKIEDKKRTWANQGLAKFADILRQNTSNIEELGYNIISNLVNYLNANQGAIFILNDDNENNLFLEQTATYAYDRKKHLSKQIIPGEGLLGSCFLEKETILLTEIPESYLKITSGLGQATPKCLLIVPLKINENIYGVIEIASFKKFEQFEVEFIEKIGESIASTISTAKVNQTTTRLLKESREQAELLAQQEEEMRQNMEEMLATQEESSRKEAEAREASIELKNKMAEVEELQQLFKEETEIKLKEELETRKLYEGEINQMFDLMTQYITRFEEKNNKNKN